jgi:hypothetical protein
MGWETLLSIWREAADEARAEATAPPQACPRCGEPVRSGPDGVLYCRFDGWRWQGGGP